MFEKYFSLQQASLIQYFEHMSSIVIVVINSNLEIISCNQGFITLLNLSTIPIGRKILDFMASDSTKSLPLPLSNEILPFQLLLQGKNTFSFQVKGAIIGLTDSFLIIGEKPLLTCENLISTISSLNNELTDLVRELHKKNNELEKANATIQKLMNTDPLTGLWNRRYFMIHLESAFSYSKRHGVPISLVMADIDHFKIINDTFGHSVGDQVLIQVSDIFTELSRKEDVVARFGGEEFIILLPHTNSLMAGNFAERLRKKIERSRFSKFDYHLTVSFGVAEKTPFDTLETFIKRVDDALYQAKRNGRNQTFIDKNIEHPVEIQGGSGLDS